MLGYSLNGVWFCQIVTSACVEAWGEQCLDMVHFTQNFITGFPFKENRHKYQAQRKRISIGGGWVGGGGMLRGTNPTKMPRQTVDIACAIFYEPSDV